MEPIIFNELKKYIEDDLIRFDVPGHKGNYFDNDFVSYFGENIIRADVNSMKRLDNLNYPSSIIKQSQKNIAHLHNALDSRFLLNGSTMGIQVMVLSSIKPNEKILVPQNIHKSVLSAIILSGAIPIYVDVDFDKQLGIYTKLNIENIKKTIEYHNDIKVALLINPSYYGISFDLKNIIKYLKSKNVVVLVDEAHGGQFYLTDQNNAIKLGADMSTISYHKTLGTMTQTSLLLFNSNTISINDVDIVYTMLNTTSPSYILMANLEVIIIDLFKNKKDKFLKTINELKSYKKKLNEIKGIDLLDNNYFNLKKEEFDELRLLISVKNLSLSGYEVYEKLRDEYNIQIELGEFNIILCIVSIFEDLNNINELIVALKDLSNKYYTDDIKQLNEIKHFKQKEFNSLRNTFYMEKELINYKQSINRRLSQSLMLYPPGIPFALQGEKVTKEIIQYIDYLLENGEQINGVYSKNNIYVLKGE